ncbi:hypothetical protein EK21DRAFT_114133 [Setomelanomma holmii]|uniref:Uncharacterized protein n=1 Tax=Setomelanomma holmii TaxID=210430 RepID=A0A9P4H785_9PLEO|nr:hypothetical protein EK21DRAFT_114133 [Setomelanomma holmii]
MSSATTQGRNPSRVRSDGDRSPGTQEFFDVLLGNGPFTHGNHISENTVAQMSTQRTVNPIAASAETPILPDAFFQSVSALNDTNDRLRWYMSVHITLSSANYPDVIPGVYNHLDTRLLSRLDSQDARKSEINRIREGLIKSTGIVGAVGTGNAMGTLSDRVPESLRETECMRAKESDEEARMRGRKFWTNIYASNPAVDLEASVRVSPDYAFVVRDVLYARVFSFDGILDDRTTGYAMLFGLYEMDCPNQLQHHMKGIKLRHGPAPIPVLPHSNQLGES